jgi:hypothetical protein
VGGEEHVAAEKGAAEALVKKVVFVAEVLPFVGQRFQLFR